LYKHLCKDKLTLALFKAATHVNLGDGARCSFWYDPWLEGQSLADRFPALHKHSTSRNRSVQQAVVDSNWICSIKRQPTHEVLLQFIQVWNILRNVQLNDSPDQLRWKFESSGSYSAAFAYQIQFHGRVSSPAARLIWRIGIPNKIHIFAWIVVQKRCIPHNPICQLCRTPPETAAHIFGHCSFSLQFWIALFHRYNLTINARPSSFKDGIIDWWINEDLVCISTAGKIRLGVIIMLGWWHTWLERNLRGFQNKQRSATQLCSIAAEELQAWKFAGCKGAIFFT
ncbi:hypothetical protein BRADI_2g01749v3, partial [Brachypodium distachyon]